MPRWTFVSIDQTNERTLDNEFVIETSKGASMI